MAPHHLAYFYALGASVTFSSASLVIAHYSQRFSAKWMNVYKLVVCFLLMTVSLAVSGNWPVIDMRFWLMLMASGAMGLGLGDMFLLGAYARMGAGRTLILYGFQPVFLGVASIYLFNQSFSGYRLISILFFLICLYLFSLEKYKERGHWELTGLVLALLGVLLDSTGVLMTRWCFDGATGLEPLQANFVRCLGGMVFVTAAWPFLKLNFLNQFKSLTGKEKILTTGASALGTFLALVLYLEAVRIGHLASLAALSVFGPLFATSLECLWQRRWPSAYLILALLSFLIGFTMILSF